MHLVVKLEHDTMQPADHFEIIDFMYETHGYDVCTCHVQSFPAEEVEYYLPQLM